jgi:hypothetical protein
MRTWVKAFGLFAIMVATPFVIERLLGRNPRFPGADEVGAWAWGNALTSIVYVAVALVVLAAIFGAAILYYQTEEISKQLTLAEREMTALLRGWGGGLAKDARQNMAKERADWLQIIGDNKSDMAKAFYDQNQKELDGGAQGTSMGRARFTAFLLRELYEGNVETAQAKVYNDVKNGGSPWIVAGLRRLIAYGSFDKEKGFPPGSGVDPNLLWLTVKLHRHPHHIVMVKSGSDGKKFEVKNWDVINEMNRQAL